MIGTASANRSSGGRYSENPLRLPCEPSRRGMDDDATDQGAHQRNRLVVALLTSAQRRMDVGHLLQQLDLPLDLSRGCFQFVARPAPLLGGEVRQIVPAGQARKRITNESDINGCGGLHHSVPN